MNEEKFSGKAEIYDKYRPTYPTALINVLYNEIHGDENSRVADIGAGTGIFTKALLGKFRNVTAIEPNGDMYSVLRANLPDITAVQNSAENTGLPQSSFDLITTAQAFHWFDKDMFRNECKRILKPNGKLAVIWNRRVRNDFWARRDEIFTRYCETFHTGHVFVGHNGVDEDKEGDKFFKEVYLGDCKVFTYDNPFLMTKEQFIGDTLSRSHAPKSSDGNYREFLSELEKAFDEFVTDGHVTVLYQTVCYLGTL